MNINNFSIGVDIESIIRFRNLDRKRSANFLSKIFTEREINYCFLKKASAQHFAVRFAVKEAIVKAISSLDKKIVPLHKIEIIRNSDGTPTVDLKGYNVKISLSHCEDKAIAIALIMIGNDRKKPRS